MIDCSRFRIAARLSPALFVALTLFGTARPSSAADKPDPGVGVFDPGKVWQVHITLSAEEYAAMSPAPPAVASGSARRRRHPRSRSTRSGRSTGTTSAWTCPGRPGRSPWATRRSRRWASGTRGTGRSGTPPAPSRSRSRSTSTASGGAGRFGGSEDDQPALRGDRPVEVPGDSRVRAVPRGRGCRRRGRPWPRCGSTVPGKYDKELLGALHGRRGGGQVVPARPFRGRQGPADEAGGGPRVRGPGRRLGPVQERSTPRSGRPRRTRRSG